MSEIRQFPFVTHFQCQHFVSFDSSSAFYTLLVYHLLHRTWDACWSPLRISAAYVTSPGHTSRFITVHTASIHITSLLLMLLASITSLSITSHKYARIFAVSANVSCASFAYSLPCFESHVCPQRMRSRIHFRFDVRVLSGNAYMALAVFRRVVL